MQNYSKAEHWVQRHVRGEHILMPTGPEAGRHRSFFTMNETASRIWDLAGEGLDADAIARRVGEEFEVPEDRAARDVRAILDELTHLGALTADGGA
jgi:hypothetical protein